MADTSAKTDTEFTYEYWRHRRLEALQEADWTTDPAKRAYLRALAQDMMTMAAQAAQKRRSC